ncbi:MAG: hypothetical protein OEW23_18145, partial [Candidatus Aminicenantes bacterium]|nr:hypothetical protein [Candidatus Aminicenantes bacterium]
QLNRILIQYSNKLLSLFQFIKDLDAFIQDSFETLSSTRKFEIVFNFLEAKQMKKYNPAIGEIIDVFFGSFPSFLSLILQKSRQEENVAIRIYLIEFMLDGSKVPIHDSTFFDYLPGLHHKEDLNRCQALNFLYHNFGEKVLPAILREVFKMNPPPSVLFCGTLGHFFCRHPHIPWADMLKKEDFNLDKWDRKDGRWLFLHAMKNSISRIQFLSLILGEDHRDGEKGKTVEFKPRKPAVGFRTDRFIVIEAQINRR